VVDPEDIEGLEDLIVAAMKDGFEQALELRNASMAEIMPDLPNIPGFTV
ncbi:MAG: YbaB/EbfC family nucleoid-associated protein, partial [Armatimonadota bacterium]